MALNFPQSPALNDVYTYNGWSWRWNGTSWVTNTLIVGPSGPTGPLGPTGATGVQGPTGAQGDRYSTTSSTPLSIPTDGSTVTITVGTGLAYTIGQEVVVAYDLTRQFYLEITTYNSVTGSMSGVTSSKIGSGTFSAWTVNLTGVAGIPGASGPTGVAGPTGATGVVGVTGATGPIGVTGATGVIGVSGATGVAGVTGPTGATGVQGIQGVIGVSGATGIQGVIGVSGATGVQGVVGVTGATGVQGIQGVIGVSGATGIQGVIGVSGATGVVGVTGATGSGYYATSTTSFLIGTGSKAFTTQANLAYVAGQYVRISYSVTPTNWMEGQVTSYTGTTLTVNVTLISGSGTFASWNISAAGIQGATGVIGVSGATGVQGVIGVSGATGIQGVIGVSGATGVQGVIGVSGATGIQGVIGVSGATGVQGVIGVSGATGVQGVIGVSGATGPIGVTGATGVGITGATGVIGVSGATGPRGVTGATGATNIPTVDVYPASPVDGDLFWDTNTGTIKIWYVDADGGQWVDALTGSMGPQGATGASGPRSIIPNAQTSSYTLQVSDVGKYISITTGGVTVPAAIFSAGDIVSVYNNSGGSQTITSGASVTMYLGGSSTTGNRSLSQRGVCTILCVGTNTFVAMGVGLA